MSKEFYTTLSFIILLVCLSFLGGCSDNQPETPLQPQIKWKLDHRFSISEPFTVYIGSDNTGEEYILIIKESKIAITKK